MSCADEVTASSLQPTFLPAWLLSLTNHAVSQLDEDKPAMQAPSTLCLALFTARGYCAHYCTAVSHACSDALAECSSLLVRLAYCLVVFVPYGHLTTQLQTLICAYRSGVLCLLITPRAIMLGSPRIELTAVSWLGDISSDCFGHYCCVGDNGLPTPVEQHHKSQVMTRDTREPQ